MAARIIAQIIVMGTQIVGKAFIEAYKQAAANAARGGASGAAGQGSKSTMDALTKKTGMTFEEACQILNVTKDAELKEVAKNYEHLFKVNSTEQGNSFYLQSKVVCAKERIEAELAQNIVKEGHMHPNHPPSEGPPPSGGSGPSASV